MAVASRVIPLSLPRGTHGLSDRLLVARVASGDDQAFEGILERYGPALLSFCAHMLGSREWGEDALQLTFVAAYQALRRGGCDGELRPWLYAIARNRCLSELRACREIPDSDRVSAERPTIDDPASLFARREQLREIVEDIQRLPADQRAALVLFELGDHSHDEIATLLGVRRDKVKALIFQAREGLYRGRSARESACSQVREGLANARGNAPARGPVRAHVDRCPSCQKFAGEVRRQRAALAVVLPVAFSGKLKALVLSSTLGHGGAATSSAGLTGAGGAGSVAGAAAAGSGSGAVAGSGSLGAAAAATATGSASTAVGAAVGGGGGGAAVSVAAGTASSTMVASALGTDALAGVGALTSVSAGTAAKLATVLAVAVGVGGVTGSALPQSPRPQVSLLAGQPAPSRSPLQPLGSSIADPLANATEPGSQPGAGATAPAGTPSTGAASAPIPPSIAAPSSSAPNPAAVSGPTAPTGTISPPAASAPGDGSATTPSPPSVSSTTTATPTTTTASSQTGSGRSTSTTTTASSPTTTAAGSSSGSYASQGPAGGSSGASGNGPGDATVQGGSSGGNPAGGDTKSNGNGPPVTPPGCVGNPAPGCTRKASRS